MEPVNIERHFECKHYAQTNKCEFKTGMHSKDEKFVLHTAERMTMLFVEGGAVSLTLGDGTQIRKDQDFTLFLDKNSEITFKFYQNCRVSYMSFDKPTRLCDRYEVSKLKPYAPSIYQVVPLELNTALQMALKLMVTYHEDELYCGLVTETKLREFFFILSAYYTPEVLAMYFTPLLREEVDFKEFVLSNYQRVSTVIELAALRGMPVRAFNKLFRDTFDMPPYQWMLLQKGKAIEKRLGQKNIPFSDIIEEFGFSSASHFTVYCRRQFGMTPSQKRKEIIEASTRRTRRY